MIDDVAVVIPAYNPDEKFIAFLMQLKQNHYTKIIVVDDGSKIETQHFFDTAKAKYGCDIIKHNINLGQGRAFKSAFNFYLGKYRGGY